jgi:hypothetical protein
MQSYYKVSRSFARRVVKPSHSVPWYRLMVYGWQPSIDHFDFAGILNASAIYSFSVGPPQLVFSFAFLFSPASTRTPAPCEMDTYIKCGLVEDFNRPNVQTNVVLGGIFVSLVSMFISIANIIIDFPSQIFEIVEEEEANLFIQLQAEAATKKWEDKLRTELDEGVKSMLKVSTQLESNKVKGAEGPMLVLDDVIRLERKAMKKKMKYLDYFTREGDKQLKAKADARKKKKADEPK